MRVREIMSSPVVTVPPGMPLKEVANVLVTRAISAVPVVDAGELVGILSEADLVPLELVPDPRAHLAPVPEAPDGTPGRVPGHDTGRHRAARGGRRRRRRPAPAGAPHQVDPGPPGPPGRGHRGPAGPAGGAGPQRRGIARDLEALLAAELGSPSPYRVPSATGRGPHRPPDLVDRRLARCWPAACPESSRSGWTRSDGHDHLSRSSGGRRRPAGRLDRPRAAGQARRRARSSGC